jgi:hypothetical protein
MTLPERVPGYLNRQGRRHHNPHESFSDGTPEQMAAADLWFLLLGYTASTPLRQHQQRPALASPLLASATYWAGLASYVWLGRKKKNLAPGILRA